MTVDEAVAVAVDETIEVEDRVAVTDGEDGLNPLQKPFWHVLYAHCESDEHSAWKLPQVVISMALTA